MKKLTVFFVITLLFITSCMGRNIANTSIDITAIEILVNFFSGSISISPATKFFQNTNDSGKIIQAIIGYNENNSFDDELHNKLSNGEWKERIRLLNEIVK